jgi:hypothetical protein
MENHNETLFFTLGYTLHLPEFNAAGELCDGDIDATFTMGPDVTPSGELIWDPNADDTNHY